MEYKFKTSKGYCKISNSGFCFFNESCDEYNLNAFNNKINSVEEITMTDKRVGKVAIFLSENCNLRCIYCYANSGKGVRIVSLESAKVLIDFISERCEYFILDFHGGGEPLIFFDLIKEIYDYAYATGKLFRTVLISNGYILQRKEEILDWIVKHINVFAISCDGKPEVQNSQRPTAGKQASSAVVEETITNLVNRNYEFTVRATVTGASDKYMYHNIQYFHSLGVKNIIFSPCYNYGRSNDIELLPNPKIYVEQFMRCFEYAYKNDIILRTTSFRMPGKNYCGALPAYNICLTVDNYISTCYEVTSRNDSASDLFFVGKIENGEVKLFKENLNKLKNVKFNNINCSQCECSLVCRGGCPVKQYRNSIRSSGNLCAITKMLVPRIIDFLHHNPDSAKNILRNSDLLF